MGKIMGSILETIGNTPLVELSKLNAGKARVLAKMEYFNPGSSVKDRAAFAMIEDAEKSGKLKPGALIIEPTSGNMGIGLALVAAVKGYKLILTMPDTMSIERRKILAAYGAQLVLTDGAKGMKGSIEKANEILADNPGAFMPRQFDNPVNAAAHRKTTAEEIWRDTDGRVDYLVAGVGTGGTITGTGGRLKELNPQIKNIAVEPVDSPVLSGGAPGPHKIQGIGAGFVPNVLDTTLIDEVVKVRHEDAGTAARKATREEGLFIGISAGAALHAALEISKRPEAAGKTIVAILPDCGERYISSWLFEQAD